PTHKNPFESCKKQKERAIGICSNSGSTDCAYNGIVIEMIKMKILIFPDKRQLFFIRPFYGYERELTSLIKIR
ncbi:MAG: hypothetical protein OQK52_10190, partial [Ignavibacteriaceae bacterium]|nr:hypothetical protein [Ignavibacteriaceae bacterium]